MSYLTEITSIVRKVVRSQSGRLTLANFSSSSDKKSEDDEVYDEEKLAKKEIAEMLADEVDLDEREKEIAKMRNKARLRNMHRNLLNKVPIDPQDYPWEKTVYYVRKQYGRYGSVSGVDPRLCFELPDEADDKREYERVKYPYTIQEMAEISRQAKAEKLKAIQDRENKIERNLGQLDKWMADMQARVAKKEKEAREAKAKREMIMEEVRQHFGFKMDLRDPRFLALIEEKEKEAKKARKAERKKKQDAILVEKLQEQAAELAKKKEKDAKKNAEDSDDDEGVKKGKKKKK